jgi:hypothetical protein
VYLLVDVSGWAAVLMAISTCVGGGASISAASNQPVCVIMFGVFLVQVTSNKAKNQCRNMDRGLRWSSIGQCWSHFEEANTRARGMKVFRGHSFFIICCLAMPMVEGSLQKMGVATRT